MMKNSKKCMVFLLCVYYLLVFFPANAQVKYIQTYGDTTKFKYFITISPTVNPGFGKAIVMFGNTMIEQAIREASFDKSVNIYPVELDSISVILAKSLIIANSANMSSEKCQYCGVNVYFHTVLPYEVVRVEGIIRTEVFFEELNRRIRSSNLSKNTKTLLLYLFDRS